MTPSDCADNFQLADGTRVCTARPHDRLHVFCENLVKTGMCPIEVRKKREAARPVLPDKTCDPSCPCRTPVCEETCPEYQFKGRFASWLAVNYPALDIASHQDIVDSASEIFDDIAAGGS